MVKGGDPCPTGFRENSKFEGKFGVWRSLVKVAFAEMGTYLASQ